jgi:COP9 signalosome complex subunit 4
MSLVEERIDAALSSSDAAINACVDELIAVGDAESLTTFVDKLFTSDLSQTRIRGVVLHLAKSLKTISTKASSHECFEIVSTYIVGKLKNQVGMGVSHDDADYILRDALFEYYLSTAEYAEAAQALAGLNLDSSTRVYSDMEKVDILVKISEVYLEDLDHVEKAETFVSKASALMNNISDTPLQLRYRTTSARVLDLNRKFVDAAVRFYELSCMTNVNVLTVLLYDILYCLVLMAV